MRISYNWLKDYIDLNIDADELGRRYTAAGLELDETVSRGRDFSGVVVGRVLTCEPVEGSDHLHLCSVDIGEGEPLTVFCGAPNVAAGQLICCAKVGAKLPGDFVIGERKMFGRISQGMICSQQELGVSDDHSGIWVLDDAFAGEEAPLGEDIADALGLKDDVLIIELTPNRSDCLGMLNCAREAGALTGNPVRAPASRAQLSMPRQSLRLGVSSMMSTSSLSCRASATSAPKGASTPAKASSSTQMPL